MDYGGHRVDMGDIGCVGFMGLKKQMEKQMTKNMDIEYWRLGL